MKKFILWLMTLILITMLFACIQKKDESSLPSNLESSESVSELDSSEKTDSSDESDLLIDDSEETSSKDESEESSNPNVSDDNSKEVSKETSKEVSKDESSKAETSKEESKREDTSKEESKDETSKNTVSETSKPEESTVSEVSEDPKVDDPDYPIIKGSFIQYKQFLSYTDKRLEQHFDYLSEVGIEYLVLYFSAFQSKTGSYETVYYPSEIAKQNKSDLYDDSAANITERILRECQKHGIKAYISPLNSIEGWASYGVTSSKWHMSFAEDYINIAEEMYNLYKNKYGDTFYGWYFGPEFSNNFKYYTENHFNNVSNLLSYCVDNLSDIDPSMPFLISPYFIDKDPYSSPVATGAAWEKILSKVNFRPGDIFCPQDCVGSGLASPDRFMEYYKRLKKAVDKIDNLAFWGNPENFKQSNWSSAPMTRFFYQLQEAAPLVEGFISFAYSHYYAPDKAGTTLFHDAYKKYYETGKIDYYSTNEKAILKGLNLEKKSTGINITIELENCKYGISYVDIYRGDEKIATVHTNAKEVDKQILTYSFTDKEYKSGEVEYRIEAIDYLDKVAFKGSKTYK